MNRSVAALSSILLLAKAPSLSAQPAVPARAEISASSPASATPDPQIPSTAGGGNPGRRSIVAVRIRDDEGINLDGRLDEDIWARATPATDFVQQDPDNGQPATERTEVRIVYDRNALYMGVTCFDSEPDKWIGFQRRRDEFLSADDRFQWVFDTYLDQRSSYFFETNPSGLMGDALRGPGTNNRQWDGIWNERVRHTEVGWIVEIQIPFSTLSFNPSSDTWGINFQRTIRRKNEETLWSGWGRNQGLTRLTNEGFLTGLSDISQGHGIDVKPYGLGTWQSSPGRANVADKGDAKFGADVFYSPTPQMRTALTLNTDFAQTEVDQRLTNLTRFPLFFQEKRDFFLDGSNFFDFQTQSNPNGQSSGSNQTLIPYFSRRIGLSPAGLPQKIDVGARLAGQVGREDIGALYVRTGEEQAAIGENFLVLRMKHRMLRQSYVGALYSGRQSAGTTAGTSSLHTAGADFTLATSSFRGGQNLEFGGFYLDTNNPNATKATASYGFKLDYPNDLWAWQVLYREIQENFYAATGFVPRTGYRRLHPKIDYSPRPNSRLIRRYSYGADLQLHNSTIDGRTLNRDWDLRVMQIDFQSGDSLQAHVLPSYEYLDSNFTIAPGITLPRGNDYSWYRYRFQLNTADRRTIAIVPVAEFGTFYSGTRTRTALDVNIRARPGVIIYTSTEVNRVHLDEGSFQTKLFRVVPELQFSPWISWVNNIQYDSQSALVGWQSRFRWILKPGNDLYIVYTHNWLDDPLLNRFTTLDKNASSKVLYTLRF